MLSSVEKGTFLAEWVRNFTATAACDAREGCQYWIDQEMIRLTEAHPFFAADFETYTRLQDLLIIKMVRGISRSWQS